MEAVLTLPMNAIDLDIDEMEYVDGGGTFTLTLKRDFLRDVATALCSAICGIICGIIGSACGPVYGSLIGGSLGAALGWIIGGSLSRKYINKDITLKIWIPFGSCSFTIN
ncbi:hypothetical protein V6C21_07960 [[Clostridium] cellulosi]